MDGELDVIRGGSEDEERVVPNGERLVELSGECLVVRREVGGGGADVGGGQSQRPSRVDSGRKGEGEGAVGLSKDRGSDVKSSSG